MRWRLPPVYVICPVRTDEAGSAGSIGDGIGQGFTRLQATRLERQKPAVIMTRRRKNHVAQRSAQGFQRFLSVGPEQYCSGAKNDSYDSPCRSYGSRLLSLNGTLPWRGQGGRHYGRGDRCGAVRCHGCFRRKNRCTAQRGPVEKEGEYMYNRVLLSRYEIHRRWPVEALCRPYVLIWRR